MRRVSLASVLLVSVAFLSAPALAGGVSRGQSLYDPDESWMGYPEDEAIGEYDGSLLYRSSGLLAGGGASSLPLATLQEPPGWPEEGGAPAAYSVGRVISHDMSFGLQFASISGVAIDFGSDDVDYGDIFGAGVGFHLQWRMHISSGQEFGREISWGPAVFFDYLNFVGDEWTDPVGDTLEPDDMTLYRLLVGIHFRSVFGGVFFVAAQMGIGLAMYDDVDADFTISGFTATLQLFEATTTLGFDLAARIGAKWDVGTSAAIGFFGFGGFAIVGPPGEGKDVQNLDSEAPGIAFGGIAFEIDFGRANQGGGPYIP